MARIPIRSGVRETRAVSQTIRHFSLSLSRHLIANTARQCVSCSRDTQRFLFRFAHCFPRFPFGPCIRTVGNYIIGSEKRSASYTGAVCDRGQKRGDVRATKRACTRNHADERRKELVAELIARIASDGRIIEETFDRVG